MSDEGTIAAMAIVPIPWPPPVLSKLLEMNQDGALVTLAADTDGRLSVSVLTARQARTRAFGPIRVPGGSRVIVMLRWSPAGLFLSLNGTDLAEEEIAAEALQIPVQLGSIENLGCVYKPVALRADLLPAEELFVATVLDVDQKVAAGDRYSVIRASGLLRQLLVDESPLVHVVNRAYSAPLIFRTIDFSEPPPLDPVGHWQVLDPSPFSGAKTLDCSLKQFLAAPCLKWSGRYASVHDLITACANAKGGTHLGRARTTDQQLLLDWDEAVSVLGEWPSVRAMAGTCRVALQAFRPLMSAVEGGAA